MLDTQVDNVVSAQNSFGNTVMMEVVSYVLGQSSRGGVVQAELKALRQFQDVRSDHKMRSDDGLDC
jgi:hypothetical protein